jgi:hypothetical protein
VAGVAVREFADAWVVWSDSHHFIQDTRQVHPCAHSDRFAMGQALAVSDIPVADGPERSNGYLSAEFVQKK